MGLQTFDRFYDAAAGRDAQPYSFLTILAFSVDVNHMFLLQFEAWLQPAN